MQKSFLKSVKNTLSVFWTSHLVNMVQVLVNIDGE
jgi:hypothetical protein